MATSIISDVRGVNWQRLKADLAADRFDNGRSAVQLRRSFENSNVCRLATEGDRVIGTVRLLSDGVCNAYLVDLWTLFPFRRRGIASELVRQALGELDGQHVALFAQGPPEFFRKLGFETEPGGMSRVVGRWLSVE